MITEFALEIFYFWCLHACTQLSICSEALTLQIESKKSDKKEDVDRDSEICHYYLSKASFIATGFNKAVLT